MWGTADRRLMLRARRPRTTGPLWPGGLESTLQRHSQALTSCREADGGPCAIGACPLACHQDWYNLTQPHDDKVLGDLRETASPKFRSSCPTASLRCNRMIVGIGASVRGCTNARRPWIIPSGSPNLLHIRGSASMGPMRQSLSSAESKLPTDAVERLVGIATPNVHTGRASRRHAHGGAIARWAGCLTPDENGRSTDWRFQTFELDCRATAAQPIRRPC
jgi:hypothetical protein